MATLEQSFAKGRPRHAVRGFRPFGSPAVIAVYPPQSTHKTVRGAIGRKREAPREHGRFAPSRLNSRDALQAGGRWFEPSTAQWKNSLETGNFRTFVSRTDAVGGVNRLQVPLAGTASGAFVSDPLLRAQEVAGAPGPASRLGVLRTPASISSRREIQRRPSLWPGMTPRRAKSRTVESGVFHHSQITGEPTTTARCYQLQTSRGDQTEEGYHLGNVLGRDCRVARSPSVSLAHDRASAMPFMPGARRRAVPCSQDVDAGRT
jgi:hypothetical protein